MLASFHFAFQSGSLSISQRREVISLIPKKNKDKSILENLRPISLLNVDYKILTKVISKRIEKTLPKIINPDQTGYVKGRYIGENIRLIQDVLKIAWIKRITENVHPAWKIIPEFPAAKYGGLVFLTKCQYDIKHFNLDNLPPT